jgi:hypothetical protein
MELKRLITHFTYRIEPKPEGGFIAHATDATVPPLEAASREELQQKIQAKIAAALASEFPGLKLPLENRELKYAFHIERTPGGGFAIHSADPNTPPIEGVAHDEIESHFAEKLIAFLGKHLMPELSQALAAQGKAGDIKVFVNRKAGFTVSAAVSAGSPTLSLGTRQGLPPAGSIQHDGAKIEDANLGEARTTNADFGRVGDTIGNSPITPESSGSWKIFSLLLAALAVAALMYFFFHYR